MTQDTAYQPETVAPEAAQATEVYEDYWGVQEVHRFWLPDHKQYFDIMPMDEGAKTRFQKMTNKGIRMNQRAQEAIIDTDVADERHVLIVQSVVGWKLMQKKNGQWEDLPCPSDVRVRQRDIEGVILQKFNPKVIQDLEFFIRTKNPWMQADMDVEEIDNELERLTELRKQVKAQKEGEDSSVNK